MHFNDWHVIPVTGIAMASSVLVEFIALIASTNRTIFFFKINLHNLEAWQDKMPAS